MTKYRAGWYAREFILEVDDEDLTQEELYEELDKKLLEQVNECFCQEADYYEKIKPRKKKKQRRHGGNQG